MRFVSFNTNGLRARLHQLDAIITQLQPDVIGLQETKVHDKDFPIKTLLKYGYNIYYYGQKKYYGVALFLRKTPLSVLKVFFKDDFFHQKRIILADIMTSAGKLTIINVYFPHGDNNSSDKFIFKQKFYQNLQNYIQNFYDRKSLLLIMGDMNISPTDLDIGIGDKNKKKWIELGRCSFLPEERQWLCRLINWGLVDIYRNMHPYDNKRYSWFSYTSNGFSKNRGLRIDLILITQPLVSRYICSDIDYDIRSMSRPSDHAPIWVDLDI